MIKHFSSKDDASSCCPRGCNGQDLPPNGFEHRPDERGCSQLVSVLLAFFPPLVGQVRLPPHFKPLSNATEERAKSDLDSLDPFAGLHYYMAASQCTGAHQEPLAARIKCPRRCATFPITCAVSAPPEVSAAAYTMFSLEKLTCQSNEHNSTRRLVPVRSSSSWNEAPD